MGAGLSETGGIFLAAVKRLSDGPAAPVVFAQKEKAGIQRLLSLACEEIKLHLP